MFRGRSGTSIIIIYMAYSVFCELIAGVRLSMGIAWMQDQISSLHKAFFLRIIGRDKPPPSHCHHSHPTIRYIYILLKILTFGQSDETRDFHGNTYADSCELNRDGILLLFCTHIVKVSFSIRLGLCLGQGEERNVHVKGEGEGEGRG